MIHPIRIQQKIMPNIENTMISVYSPNIIELNTPPFVFTACPAPELALVELVELESEPVVDVDVDVVVIVGVGILVGGSVSSGLSDIVAVVSGLDIQEVFQNVSNCKQRQIHMYDMNFVCLHTLQ